MTARYKALETLLIILSMYLLGSFIAISFDITEWEGIGRFLIAVFVLVGSIVNIAIGVTWIDKLFEKKDG